MSEKIKVIVSGALGKMGMETARAVHNDPELELVGLVDIRARGEVFGDIAGNKEISLTIHNDLDKMIEMTRPDVMVDFTNPQAVYNNTRTALKQKITSIVGTTGLNEVELRQLEKLALDKQVGVAVIPNFALGAVLMMKLAQEAAQYFPDVEIIELHHDQKLDAPSGTAIKTAEMITANRQPIPARNSREFEKISGARGGEINGIRVHSVRLPGLIAHQEVIFGGVGQSLRIRHDSFDRVGFMPGVIMSIKKMITTTGLVYGLENLL
ncbi:Dihydrodipicolinate reductase, bacterial/plant [Syntrophomonas zehnderi OL-4]|uniref:4-hydroxy-tetrahydrodipicolinate reductase n=1 Tax=Syntrophomonas zehnderi OL-4 TaxID=690567 RepID=A0A0E4C8Z8_9FIRM|nr:4-hydroxy-tetrahydrodipicolinate reductase [Syntrophomonas zehnderi]CFX75606.1 Dihydrodipicolinate reductase, bacterial/plant [Syntrophomonas zehnderi OL-4]